MAWDVITGRANFDHEVWSFKNPTSKKSIQKNFQTEAKDEEKESAKATNIRLLSDDSDVSKKNTPSQPMINQWV